MKYLTFSFIVLVFTSCEIINTEEEIPAIIDINDITVSGGYTSNISDAWVYVDNEFIGVYPLPASFPILKTGLQSIVIDAGIKKNGISSSRENYDYYTSFTQDVNLESNKSTSLNPEISYSISSFPFVEDFEGIGTVLEVITDSANHQLEKVYDNSNSMFGNYHAKSTISGQFGEIFECNSENINLPTDRKVYLELDYKCNSTLVVGMYCNYPSQVVKSAVMYLNPKSNWNKIYISLSELISNHTNAQDFKLFFGMSRDTTLTENNIFLDNIRLVYEE
ncbi:MAG: hypothetical protein ACON4E_00160 [Flavobacteriales bacterium]